MPIWNPKHECMERREMRKLQSARLTEIVKHTYNHVEYYRNRMNEAGITPDDIQSIDDIHLLPFTTKQDLRDNYPFGSFAVPMKQIVRTHASSGTTGKPIVAGYTQKDIDNWSEGVARVLSAGGVTQTDVVQISYGYGLFTGGLGLHDGTSLIGSTIVPTSSGNTQKQITLMHDLKCTTLCCTPSYALYLAEEIEKENLDVKTFRLRSGFFGAEPWTEGMRKELERKLHIKAYDIYGLTEISGPGVGGECKYQNGTHLWEDLFYPEIVDPQTLQPLSPGLTGELVFTTLDKWGMPMLRYRTRDLTYLNYEQCECGRTAVRMGRILGRSDDMLIVRGVNVFPSTVESVLMEFDVFTPQYFITIDRVDNIDTFDLDVELKPEFYSSTEGANKGYIKQLQSRLNSVLGLRPTIKLCEPNSIERSSGKAKHVLDKRVFKN